MLETVDKLKLLANISRFYRETLRKSKDGRELAKSLGLSGSQTLEEFGAGYADGSLMRAIPAKGEIMGILTEIGLLNEENQELAQGRLMLPIHDIHKNVAGFISIDPNGQEFRLPSFITPFGLNLEALQEKTVVFTAQALQVLLLAQAGYSNAVAASPDPSDEERSLIQRFRPEKALILGDLPGLVRLLQKLEVPCYRLALEFPASSQRIEQAIQGAEPIGENLGPDAVAKVSEDVIRFECGARKYELRELSPGEADRLRVRLIAHAEGRFHLDTLDLYAGRSRMGFARSAAAIFGVSEAAVEGDLCLMIRKMEAIRASRKNEGADSGAYVMTADEEAEALEFLKRPDILNRVVSDLESMGYVGEEVNKKIGYLITISRKLSSPLCGVILSRAAAGKSRLLEVLADLVPLEDLVSYTRITPQALYYAENRSLKNKLVIAGEDEGLAGSDYALRELISSKRIKLAAPLKDTMTGKMKTVQYEVEGPIALLFSTTKPSIHYENSTRCFLLSLDESSEQTERVMKFQREKRTLEGLLHSLEGRSLKRLHQNAQRMLKPLLVVNPFAGELHLASKRIESRREHEKYLSLIEAIAFLHQHQRSVKKFLHEGRELEYIEATKKDIAEADKLMAEALENSAEGELSGPSRKLLEQIEKMVLERSKKFNMEPKAFQFNRRDIREFTGWSDNQIKAHIKRLEELEYLLVKSGERGKMYRYELPSVPEKTNKTKNLESSWQPVGQKLGGPISTVLDGEMPSSWEVGQKSGDYRGIMCSILLCDEFY